VKFSFTRRVRKEFHPVETAQPLRQSGLRSCGCRRTNNFNFTQSAIGIHDFEIANPFTSPTRVFVMISFGGTSSVTMRSGMDKAFQSPKNNSQPRAFASGNIAPNAARARPSLMT